MVIFSSAALVAMLSVPSLERTHRWELRDPIGKDAASNEPSAPYETDLRVSGDGLSFLRRSDLGRFGSDGLTLLIDVGTAQYSSFGRTSSSVGVIVTLSIGLDRLLFATAPSADESVPRSVATEALRCSALREERVITLVARRVHAERERALDCFAASHDAG